MDFLNSFIRFLVYLFAPFGLIFGGGGMISFGIEYEWNWFAMTGGVLVLAGIVWGLVLFLMNGGFSLFGD